MRTRNYGINIRVTEKEKALISRKAAACQLTLSEYMRQVAFGQEPKEIPRKEIYDLLVKVSQVKVELRPETRPKFISTLNRIVKLLYENIQQQ